MAIAFLLIGLVSIIAAVRGTHAQFFALLKKDFTGPDNFVIWMAALFAIGAVGYYKPLRGISSAFLVLVILVMILAQQKNGSGGFFQQLDEQLKATQQTPTKPAVTSDDVADAFSLIGSGAGALGAYG